jgi:hypothetical protein
MKSESSRLAVFYFGKSTSSPFDIREMDDNTKKNGIFLP